MRYLKFVALAFIFTSCAAGSLTSVFSLRCMTAQELSKESEEKLIEKIVKEVKREPGHEN